MGSANKIANGVIWSIILNIIKGLYGFFSVPILLSYYGKSEYGIISLATSINVYMQLMDMGFNSTNIRFFSSWLSQKDFVHTNRLFQTSLSFYGIIGLLNGLILLVMSFFSREIFSLNESQDDIMKNLLYILSASAFFSWYTSCFEQLIRATENVAWAVRWRIVPLLIQLIMRKF